jgi:hypothetical protein
MKRLAAFLRSVADRLDPPRQSHAELCEALMREQREEAERSRRYLVVERTAGPSLATLELIDELERVRQNVVPIRGKR